MRAVLAVAVFLALLLHGVAEHGCTTWSTSLPEMDVLGAYYVDLDLCTPHYDCLDSAWVYEESNGLAGLQRGDEVLDDTCHGMIEPDTVIF